MSNTLSKFSHYIITIASCVAIIALGIVYLANSAPVVTTIGENISTNDLDVNGTTTISGNLNAKTGRSASVVIAASDSPDQIKAQADYVCDGTDDDVEIQAAVNSGIKDIYLAEGTFNVTGFTISGKDALYFHGSGPATIVKLETNSPLETSNVITFDNCDNVMVSDLVVDGNRENHSLSTNEDRQNCLRFIGCDGVDVHGITTRNHWMSGIKIGSFSGSDACANVKIYGNTVDHVDDAGIAIWKSEYVTISGNVVNDSGWAGIVLTRSNDLTVSDNLVSNNSYTVSYPTGEGSGIASEGSYNFVISNNVIWDNNATGILISWWWEDYAVSKAGEFRTT
jgi:parallel beta-helix repeat protein